MWQSKRKVVAVDDENAIKLEVTSASSGRGSKRKNGGASKNKKQVDRQLREFFNNVGRGIESLIDKSPLGVPNPEPWNEMTDKRKAVLSNPVVVLNTVSETIDALSPGKILTRMESSSWMVASTKMLVSLREGLAAAVKAEEAMHSNVGRAASDDVPVMVEIDVDATVSSGAEEGQETDAPFVDLGADRWGNSTRSSNPAKEALVEAKKIKKVSMKKILALIDNLTLRANGIVVTSDDCSVECSLSSLVDDAEYEACLSPYTASGTVSDEEEIDFEECPSVVTELAEEDDLEDDEEQTETVPEETTNEEAVAPSVQVEETEVKQEFNKELNCTQDLTSDEEEDFVMAEEPESDEEDWELDM